MAQNIKMWEDDTPLSKDELSEMEIIRQTLGNKFCRGCGFYMPCPEGIEISTVTFLKIFSMQLPKDKVITKRQFNPRQY